MKKMITMAGLLMMACATATTTKLVTSYKDWDANNDGGLQRTEFIDGYSDSNYFNRWSNRGSSISYTDFLVDTFNFLDKNKNAEVERIEFDGQIDEYYFGTQSNNFNQWDKNSNGMIENAEFVEYANINRLAALWDNDGDKTISAREIANGMYDLCNTNKDSKVDQQEFDLWRAKRDANMSSAQVLHQ